MISLLRRWWHRDAAERCWREIYDQLEKEVQVDDNRLGDNVTARVTDPEVRDVKDPDDRDVIDSMSDGINACMASEPHTNCRTNPPTANDPVTQPQVTLSLETNNPEDDDVIDCAVGNTIIKHKNLTIEIRCKIRLERNLQTSLAAYEVRSLIQYASLV